MMEYVAHPYPTKRTRWNEQRHEDGVEYPCPVRQTCQHSRSMISRAHRRDAMLARTSRDPAPMLLSAQKVESSMCVLTIASADGCFSHARTTCCHSRVHAAVAAWRRLPKPSFLTDWSLEAVK